MRGRHAVRRQARLVVSVLLLAACLPGLASAMQVLRSGHPGEPDSLDPHRAVAAPSFVVLNDLFEGLMTLDAGGRPVPGAAESFTVSSDGRLYRFRLRQNLRWSDGAPLTSADFVYSFRRLADPRTGSTSLAALVDLLENGRAVLGGHLPPERLGVAAPDARTVELRLTSAAPYLPAVLALPAFAPVPRHVVARFGEAWTRPGHFVSNGPFTLLEWRPGQSVSTQRNPRFHAASTVRLDGVVYYPVADLNAGLRRFQAGELDVLTNFPPEKLDWLRARMPRELRLGPSLGVTVYVLNLRNPKFADVRVRQALSLAVDRKLLTDRIVRAGDAPAWGLIRPEFVGYPARKAPAGGAAAHREEARRLLALAGYGPERPLRLELLYHTSEEHKRVAVAIAAMWKQLGVDVSLRNAERQVVEVALRNGDFEVARAAWFASYADPVGLLGLLRGGSPANSSGYSNPRFDSSLDTAAAIADPARRLAALRATEDLLLADAPVIPLYFLVSRRLVSQRVVGWRDDNLTALRPVRWLSLR
jgi:ABC-type oligopeptide transport system substrate-binding subunit